MQRINPKEAVEYHPLVHTGTKGISDKQKKEQRVIWIMTENFSICQKEMYIHDQEVQSTLNQDETERSIPRHILICQK